MLRRKAYDQLLGWKSTSKGRTAILVEGARRVGKSTLVEAFAKQEYESYILVDFSNMTVELREIFDHLSNTDYFLMRLQAFYQTTLVRRASVVIFDEVQLFPEVRQAIKHLVADGRYDYIETGSLISIKKNVQHILIPSEEERLRMYPMDFEEFRWALGDEASVPILHQFFEERMPLGDGMHREMMRRFREYMLVGGMPQAVNAYLESRNMSIVDGVKRQILQLYEDDFMKIDTSGRFGMMYDAIPAQLSAHSERFHISAAVPNGRADRLAEVFSEMRESMTVIMSYHVNDPRAGMAMTMNESRFRMYTADIGLFVTLAFKDRKVTENVIYEKLLSDKLPANLGYLYENAVAQALTARGDRLFHHVFQKKNSTHAYEVDFLITRGHKISPVEVKSSGYKTHASIDAFIKKYSKHTGEAYLLYTKDLHKDDGITCLPVYMAMFL